MLIPNDVVFGLIHPTDSVSKTNNTKWILLAAILCSIIAFLSPYKMFDSVYGKIHNKAHYISSGDVPNAIDYFLLFKFII